MRILDALSAMARSSPRRVILLTRTRVRPVRPSLYSGSTPNIVIVGPRLISTTLPGELKERKVSSITRALSSSDSSSTGAFWTGFRISSGSGNTQAFTDAGVSISMVLETLGVVLGSIGLACGFEISCSSKSVDSFPLSAFCLCCSALSRIKSANLEWLCLNFSASQLTRSDMERSIRRTSATSSQAIRTMIVPALPSPFSNAL